MIPITVESPALEDLLTLIEETAKWLDERADNLTTAQARRGGSNVHALDLLREQVRTEAARIHGRAQLIRFEAGRSRSKGGAL